MEGVSKKKDQKSLSQEIIFGLLQRIEHFVAVACVSTTKRSKSPDSLLD